MSKFISTISNAAGGAIYSLSTGLLKLDGAVSFSNNTGSTSFGGGAISTMGSIEFKSMSITISYGESKGNNDIWLAPGKYIKLETGLSNHSSANPIGITATVDNQILGGTKLNSSMIEKFVITSDGYYIDSSGYMREEVTEITIDSITSQSQIEVYEDEMVANGSILSTPIELNSFVDKLIYFKLYTDDDDPAYGVLTFTAVDYMGPILCYRFKRFKNNVMEIDLKGDIDPSEYEEFPSESYIYLGLNEGFITADSTSIQVSCGDMASGDISIDQDGDEFLLRIGLDGADGDVGFFFEDND